MDKLTMAHEWALVFTQHNKDLSVAAKTVSAWAFDYAYAMQAEADERVNKERPDVLLIKDKDGNCLHFHREFGRKKCMDCGASLGEWQPDWSQAPDNLVQYFAVDENGRGGWFINKPELCSDHWYWSDFEERFNNDCYDHAPSFGYQGNWQDSLRERPHGF